VANPVLAGVPVIGVRRAGQAALTVLISIVPSLAYACPVCFDAKNEAGRVAFLGTTVFLTALPLLLIGGVIYWVASRSAEDVDSEPPGGEPVEEPRRGA
jgi:hypothetical protein